MCMYVSKELRMICIYVCMYVMYIQYLQLLRWLLSQVWPAVPVSRVIKVKALGAP